MTVVIDDRCWMLDTGFLMDTCLCRYDRNETVRMAGRMTGPSTLRYAETSRVQGAEKVSG